MGETINLGSPFLGKRASLPRPYTILMHARYFQVSISHEHELQDLCVSGDWAHWQWVSTTIFFTPKNVQSCFLCSWQDFNSGHGMWSLILYQLSHPTNPALLLLFLFLLSKSCDFEKVNIDDPESVCGSVCVCVRPSQANPRKLLKLPSLNLARWLPQRWECIMCQWYWPWPSFKITTS